MQQVGIAIVQKSPSPIHPARPFARICKWFQAKLHSRFAKWLLRWGNFGRFFRMLLCHSGSLWGRWKKVAKQERTKRLRKNAAPRKPGAKIFVWVSRLVLWNIFSHSSLFETVSWSVILICAQAFPLCSSVLHGLYLCMHKVHIISTHLTRQHPRVWSDKFRDRRGKTPWLPCSCSCTRAAMP